MIKEDQKVMYIGPTIRGVVKHGAVFSGGLPERLIRLAEKKPAIRSLIPPLSEAVRAEMEMKIRGSVPAVIYSRIAALSEAEINQIMEGE